MNQAFGNNRNGGRSLYNTNLFLRWQNSALDAKPYSLTGAPVDQQYNNVAFGFNFGGPIKIPHLLPRGPNFQVNYSRSLNDTVATQAAIIPTGLITSGPGAGSWNLTSPSVASITVPSNLAALNPACAQIVGSATVFAGNIIPAGCVSHQAATLLTLYPQQTNISGNTLGYNYQVPLNTSSHSDSVGASLQKQLGNKNNLYGRFNFNDTRISNPNVFGFLDTQNNLGLNLSPTWNHRFTQRFSGNFSYNFSRQRNQLIPFFANRNNIQQTAEITGASTTPAFWGPPTLSFSSGITGLNDGVSAYNRTETNAVSVSFYWNKFRHNIQFGGDFRRQEYNYLTQSNPYGSLGFTGTATKSVAGAGGSDFANFLLGIPDTSAIAYGNADKYLRQSAYDLFITDDFRVNPEFSVTAGLRWEYGAPVTETKNRLVNLDVTPGFATETYVTASNPVGPLTGTHYPTSLVFPDYSRPEPRIGIAWRPISGSSLLIRSGYDVTNDTSVYQASAYYGMAQQYPLSTSLIIANSPACGFNMANPFVAPLCSTTSPDTFGIDPHFKVGYVQSWNLSVQRDLPYSLQMVVTYLGIKGTRGVQEILPNSCPPQATGAAPCTTAPSGYRYRTSNGNSTREAGSFELRRRLRNGFTARLLYTYSKTMDDDYSLSGQGSVTNGAGIAQDWQNPQLQRALSTTDQRNVLNFTAQYTTGMGLGGKTMMSGWKGALYKEWNIATVLTAATGTPETVICSTCITSGTGITGSVRPNAVASSPYDGAPAGYRLNAAAFAAPVGTWGDVRRNSIEGPNQFSLNATMSRTFRLHDKYTLDAQLAANNVLNHVVYTGWNTYWAQNNTSFGAPANTNAMRQISLQFRMRF